MYERAIRILHMVGLLVIMVLVLLIARPMIEAQESEIPAEKTEDAYLPQEEDSAPEEEPVWEEETDDAPVSEPEPPMEESNAPEEENDPPAEEQEEPAAPETEVPTEEELLAHWEELADDPAAYQIRVNCLQNVVTVYERDKAGKYVVPVRAMVCSVGEKTPLGSYHTINRDEWRPLFGGAYGQYSTRIVDHILFHSVPYRKKRADTLFYEEYNQLGLTVSAGCIRLSVEDAKWIFDYCALGTHVILYESEDPGPLGKPEPIYIDPESPNRGWDPTDPHSDNPWLQAEAQDS